MSLSFGPLSGSSANDTRFGVLRPDVPMPIASDTLSQLLLSDNAGEIGVGGAERPLLPFIADIRGGLGGRVEDVWRGFVKRRETLAVAWDASATGTTGGGLRKEGSGAGFGFGGLGGGLFCRMVRSEFRVRSTCRSSDEEELDAEGSSTIGAVSHVAFREERHGEWLGERDAPCRGEWPFRVPVVVVEVLALPDRGRVRNDAGDTVRSLELDRVDEPVRGAA